MLFQKIKAYKWQVLASLIMTGLMVTSSLLQPRYLQEVLEALLTGDNEAIYTIGFWLILVALDWFGCRWDQCSVSSLHCSRSFV